MADKIVRFDKWCDSCLYFKDDPDKNDNPCHNCLSIPVNVDSRRPMFWKDAKDKKGPFL